MSIGSGLKSTEWHRTCHCKASHSVAGCRLYEREQSDYDFWMAAAHWKPGLNPRSICAVLIAPTSFRGIVGWRIAFHMVGIISIIVGIVLRLFSIDLDFADEADKAKAEKSRMPFDV